MINEIPYKGSFYMMLKDGTVGLFSSQNDPTRIEVPKEIEYNNKLWDVSRILQSAFLYETKADLVSFPADSQVIAFDALSLKSRCIFEVVEIPSKLKFIHADAFDQALVISVAIQNDNRFYGLTDDSAQLIPKFCSSVIFVNKKKQVVRIRESIERISSSACYNSDIRVVTFPSSLKAIGNNAFQYCHRVERIYFSRDSQLEIIEKSAFIQTRSLKYIDLSMNIHLNELGAKSFAYSGISSIIFPSSLQMISASAFEYCANLKRIKFNEPSSLKRICMNAFSHCGKLEKIFFPPSLEFLENDAFSRCKNISRIVFTPDSCLEIIGENCFHSVSVEEISFPDSLKTIQQQAFDSCESLKFVAFNDTTKIENIDALSFQNCIKLEMINGPENIKTMFLNSSNDTEDAKAHGNECSII